MNTTHPTLAVKWRTVDTLCELRGIDYPAELAARMGMHPSNLSRIRRGKQEPGPRFIAALCTALELSPNDVIVVVGADEKRRAA